MEAATVFEPVFSGRLQVKAGSRWAARSTSRAASAAKQENPDGPDGAQPDTQISWREALDYAATMIDVVDQLSLSVGPRAISDTTLMHTRQQANASSLGHNGAHSRLAVGFLLRRSKIGARQIFVVDDDLLHDGRRIDHGQL